MLSIGIAIAANGSAATASTTASDPYSGCPGISCGQLVYIGTRGEGPGKGISAARFDGATGRMTGLGVVAEVTNPTWLVASPNRAILYSVSEVGNDGRSEGSVLGFSVDKRTGKLSPLGQVRAGGGGTTHLQILARARPPAISAANYGTGQVSVVPLNRAGVPAAPSSIVTDAGSGPTPRQRSAHPHGTATDPTGRYVFVADLGADRVFVDRFDPATAKLTAHDGAALPPGSGPRHVVVHPAGRFVYVNAEFTGDLLILRWDAAKEKLNFVKTMPTRASGYAGEISSAELALSADARFLYVSNRGEDDIVVYAVDARNGDLSEIQRLSSGGKMPASFAFDPGGHWLAVANSGSDYVSVFRCDPSSGKLTPTAEGLHTPNPATIAWLQH